MIKKYDFSDAIKQSIDEGRKRQSEYKNLTSMVEDFGRGVIAQLASRYSVPAEMRLEPIVNQPDQDKCDSSSVWRGETIMPDTYSLSAFVPSANQHVPLVNYQIDTQTCYPCIVQCGPQSVICKDQDSFAVALKQSFDARSLEIMRKFQELTSEYESSSDSDVE